MGVLRTKRCHSFLSLRVVQAAIFTNECYVMTGALKYTLDYTGLLQIKEVVGKRMMIRKNNDGSGRKRRVHISVCYIHVDVENSLVRDDSGYREKLDVCFKRNMAIVRLYNRVHDGF